MVAARNFEVWSTYNDERPNFVDGMNRYSFFFEASIHAHFVALLVALYRLYETRPETFHIPALLRLLKTHNKFDETTLARLEAMYGSVKPLWVKVSILRNEVFGHRSVKLSIEEAFEKAGLTPNNIGHLIDRTKELLNVVSEASCEDTSDTRQDLIRLLTDISRPSTT